MKVAVLAGGVGSRLAEETVIRPKRGDGVSDVDLDAPLAFHRGHGEIATLTDVRPPLATAVDINPCKWRKYIPLSGHLIIAPTMLAGRSISTVAA